MVTVAYPQEQQTDTGTSRIVQLYTTECEE